MRMLLRRSFLGLVLLSACAEVDTSGSGQADEAVTGLSQAPVPRLQHRMPRGSTSTVSLRTLPNATCKLSVAGDTDPSHQLRVFADDDGVARVQLDHLDRSVDHGQLTLDCADDAGARMTHTIDVVIDDRATPSAPAPYRRAGKPTLAKLDVPAASLTDEELVARHYPPQPDEATDPAGHAAWLQLVTSAPTVIAPHIVNDVERTHSVSGTSGNWSGYVLTSPASAAIYAWIYGEWNVPRVYPESGFSSWDHSSFWVGIDGFGSNDVVQDGTDSNTLTFFWIGTTSYDAWTEWYPLYSQTVSNFPVNPGDHVKAWTWLTDANGYYTPNPTVGRFYLWNQTQNAYAYTYTNLPSGTTFSGHSAEWVMERPTVLGSVASLPNYGTAQMTGALAYDLRGVSHLYGGDSSDTSWNVTMTGDSGNRLSIVAPVNSSTMAFTFLAHQ